MRMSFPCSTMILPNHCLRLVSPADRAKLGLVTAEEAFAAQECRSEKALQDLLVQWLCAHRGVNRVVRSRTDKATTNETGTPDLLFVYNGVPVAWECKTATGRLSLAQERASIAFMKDGWHWSLIRSFAEAKAVLDSL